MLHLLIYLVQYYASFKILFEFIAKDRAEKAFAVSFVKLMQENGTTLKDETHELLVYKEPRAELGVKCGIPNSRAISNKWHNSYLIDTSMDIEINTISAMGDMMKMKKERLEGGCTGHSLYVNDTFLYIVFYVNVKTRN
ncbi:hypothetical protein TNCV_2392191 [Trichonephila clavipes]|nr:hypothetical protein TNCV_2392191 [Trichonephila clavipes]